MSLADEKCRPYKAGESHIKGEELKNLCPMIPDWKLNGHSIEKELRFKGVPEAMDFVNEVMTVAQQEDHHPDICISYNKVKLGLSTHSVGGLSRNDFILAAKIDELSKG